MTQIYALLSSRRQLRVDLPTNVDLEVTFAVPGERGDTANSSTKPARVETGATIMVPFHIGCGDTIRVDTRTREYISRD
ncbi:MAG: elongation factor P, partial [Bacteroidetes bacterium]